MTTGLAMALVAGGVLAWYGWERSRRRTGAVAPGLATEITLPHTSEWELWHNSFSLCSKKVRACLAELGIEYTSHHVDLIETGAYGNIARDFLAVNPAATVPVLVHDGHPVFESHEQIVYAAAHSAEPNLLVPEDPDQAAVMNRWIERTSLVGDDPIAALAATAGNAVPGLTLPIFATMIEKIPAWRIVEGLLFHRIKQRALFFLLLKLRGPAWLPGMAPMVRVITRSRTALHGHLDDLESQLESSGGPWITGAQFTLADVGMMVILDRLRECDWLDEFTRSRPRVAKYWEDLRQRPGYRDGVAAFEHPTVVAGHERLVALKTTDAAFRDALSQPLPSSPA